MGKHITRLLDTLGAQSRNRSISHYYLKTILYLSSRGIINWFCTEGKGCGSCHAEENNTKMYV